jgi:sarcosine oxidase delta subunit
MHDSSTCEICRGLPVRGSLSDDEFSAFLASCRNDLGAKQETFQHRIQGASRWFYEMADGTLTIGDSIFGMTAIGTYSADYNSWLWAWANESFPAVARTASARLQSLYKVTGFRVFIDPGSKVSSADAEDFTALAVHILGAIGLFRCPSDGPVLYLAVHETNDGTD